jgi:hypothetical protein
MYGYSVLPLSPPITADETILNEYPLDLLFTQSNNLTPLNLNNFQAVEDNPINKINSKQTKPHISAKKQKKCSACASCYNSKIACDGFRPCYSCSKSKKSDQCSDRIAKVKKQRINNSGAESASTNSIYSKNYNNNHTNADSNNSNNNHDNASNSISRFISCNNGDAFKDLVQCELAQVSSFAYEFFARIISKQHAQITSMLSSSEKLNELLFFLRTMMNSADFSAFLINIIGFKAPQSIDPANHDFSQYSPPPGLVKLPRDYITNWDLTPSHSFKQLGSDFPTLVLGKPGIIRQIYAESKCEDKLCVCNSSADLESPIITADNKYERSIIIASNPSFGLLFGYTQEELARIMINNNFEGIFHFFRPEFYKQLLQMDFDKFNPPDDVQFSVAINKWNCEFPTILVRKKVIDNRGQYLATLHYFIPLNHPPAPIFLDYLAQRQQQPH